MIEALMNYGPTKVLEGSYRNIISSTILRNMRLILKKEVVQLAHPLKVRNTIITFIDDFPYISKHNNPEVIHEYIKTALEEAGVVLTKDNIPKGPKDSMLKVPRKRKQAGFVTMKEVQKPLKKMVTLQKGVQKEVQEVASIIVLMPTNTMIRSIPWKTTSYFWLRRRRN
ncbi:unnamed protein product [Vicia faba]|uniref:Reverse transcriptase domain-containing protein n=1 Tax=Vicia faba TaxID=3906 RepID=A0AAV0ZHW8_VICFA|nr:unnamed protein product [Vicia faba]